MGAGFYFLNDGATMNLVAPGERMLHGCRATPPEATASAVREVNHSVSFACRYGSDRRSFEYIGTLAFRRWAACVANAGAAAKQEAPSDLRGRTRTQSSPGRWVQMSNPHAPSPSTPERAGFYASEANWFWSPKIACFCVHSRLCRWVLTNRAGAYAWKIRHPP